MSNESRGWSAASKLGTAGLVGLVAFYLLTEHLQHTLGALPYLLVLLCPLMHFFGHHGHGHGHGASHDHTSTQDDRS